MKKENSQLIFYPPGLNLSVLCHCSCNGEAPIIQTRDECGFNPCDALGEHVSEFSVGARPPQLASQQPATAPPSERHIVSYSAALNLPLSGPPLREAEILHVLPDKGNQIEKVNLRLHVNGFVITPLKGTEDAISLAWSPFSLVQACRLHNIESDAALPWLRLFKVSVFHHGATHFFATQGEHADAERARWVADVARGVRVLTQSLFPPYTLCTMPLTPAKWTATRLLAGYMVLCHHSDVFIAYCELHSQRDLEAAFVAYKDEYCDARIVHCSITVNTSISERVGVDCSCFSIDGHHFSTRSNAEKNLWLRAISNVKTKIRHNAGNPSELELSQYRAAISESVKEIQSPSDCITRCALLPSRIPRRVSQHAAEKSRSRVDEDTDGIDPDSLARVTDHISKAMVFPCRNAGDEHEESDSCIVALGPAQDVPTPPACQAAQAHKRRFVRSPSLLSSERAGPTYKPPQVPEFIEKEYETMSASTRSEVLSRENSEEENPGPMALATAAVLHIPVDDHEDFPPVANEHLPAICFM